MRPSALHPSSSTPQRASIHPNPSRLAAAARLKGAYDVLYKSEAGRVALARYAGAVWPLGLLLLCFLGMLAVAYDAAGTAAWTGLLPLDAASAGTLTGAERRDSPTTQATMSSLNGLSPATGLCSSAVAQG